MECPKCNGRMVATTGKNKYGRPTHKCTKCGYRRNRGRIK